MHPTQPLLTTLLLCAIPALAAPRPVAISLKDSEGKPLSSRFFVLDEKGKATDGQAKDGAAQLQLEPGRHTLWLLGDEKTRVPARLWRNLTVKDEATKWELIAPQYASIAGRIVLPDGKPAANCAILVQSGANVSQPGFYWPFAPADWAKLASGARQAFAPSFTAKDGTFQINGLVPGNYAFDVFEPLSKKWFTIPFAPAINYDAANKIPTKIGDWKVPQNGWDWLLDDKLRHGGGPTKFDGQGKMKLANRVLNLGIGDDLTGVTWTDKKLPRENYEITLDARRVDGSDFFCGLTFPVGDKPLTWVNGGWGGSVVGISNLDGSSAAENETTQSRDFETGQWYRLRLRVTKVKIEAWIDDDKIIDVKIANRELSIRWSVEPSQPLGIATWKTSGELRDVRIRKLETEEIAQIERSAAE